MNENALESLKCARPTAKSGLRYFFRVAIVIKQETLGRLRCLRLTSQY